MNLRNGFNKLSKSLRVRTGYNYRNREDSNYRKQLNKIFICILVILVILVLKRIDIKFTNKVIRIVQDTLNYSINIKEDPIKALNFVRDRVKLSNKITSVFSGSNSLENDAIKYSLPINGTIYQKFGEIEKTKDVKIFHSGIDILAEEKDVYSISEGIVVEIIQSKSVRQIKIDHGDIQAVYKNIENINVNVGEQVSRGQVIGDMGVITDNRKYLHFEIWHDERPVDPLQYIDIVYNNTISL